MAQSFFRFQNAARRALKPGQQIQYIRGQGYRLVPAQGRTGAPAPPRDPLAGFGFPTYESFASKATTQANDMLTPILEMINQRQQQEVAEMRARQEAQSAATDQAYQSARAPMAGVWNSAIQQQTAVEEAVAKRLAGEGQAAGQEFAAKLAAMGAPSDTGSLESLAKTYKGAEAANYATGMNDVGRLVANAAEARSFLEKQPGLARQQAGSELAEALNELYKEYSGQRQELQANLPTQVREFQQQLYGDAMDRRKYADQLKAEREQQKAAVAEQRLKERLAAMEMGREDQIRMMERQWKLEDKEADRQFQLQMKNLGFEQASVLQEDRQAATAAEGAKNRASKPKPGAPKPMTGPQQGAIRNQIWTQIVKNGKIRERIAYASDGTAAAINREIARILRARKIGWDSPDGKSIRRLIYSQLDGMQGPKGVYRAPKWALGGK